MVRPNFVEKIFTGGSKTAKFVKVFSLESFPLYSTVLQALTQKHTDFIFPPSVHLSIYLSASLLQYLRVVCPETSYVLSWLLGFWPSPSPGASAQGCGGCGSTQDYAKEKKKRGDEFYES